MELAADLDDARMAPHLVLRAKEDHESTADRGDRGSDQERGDRDLRPDVHDEQPGEHDERTTAQVEQHHAEHRRREPESPRPREVDEERDHERDAERDAGERMAKECGTAPRDRGSETFAVADPPRTVAECEREDAQCPRLRVEADLERARVAGAPARLAVHERDHERGDRGLPRRRAHQAHAAIRGGGREHERQHDAEREEERVMTEDRGGHGRDQLRQHLVVVGGRVAGVRTRIPQIEIEVAEAVADARALGEVERQIIARGLAAEDVPVDRGDRDRDDRERGEGAVLGEPPTDVVEHVVVGVLGLGDRRGLLLCCERRTHVRKVFRRRDFGVAGRGCRSDGGLGRRLRGRRRDGRGRRLAGVGFVRVVGIAHATSSRSSSSKSATRSSSKNGVAPRTSATALAHRLAARPHSARSQPSVMP